MMTTFDATLINLIISLFLDRFAKLIYRNNVLFLIKIFTFMIHIIFWYSYYQSRFFIRINRFGITYQLYFIYLYLQNRKSVITNYNLMKYFTKLCNKCLRVGIQTDFIIVIRTITAFVIIVF